MISQKHERTVIPLTLGAVLALADELDLGTE